MGNIFKKVFGKGGAIDKATRWADKKTGGITGKLLKGAEGIVKGVPVIGGIYKGAKGVGGAMLKIATGEAKAENKAKQEVATALKSPAAKSSIDFDVTVTNKANFFTKIKNWFIGLPMWVRVIIMAVPFVLLLAWLIIKPKRSTRRRSVRRSTPRRAATRGRSRTKSKPRSKSAFVARMQAGKRKAARKRKRG